MADGNDPTGDGSGAPKAPENNGNPTPPVNDGNDWKAKYEGAVQKINEIEQNRNFFKNKSEDLEAKNVELATKVENISSEFTQFKDGVTKNEKKQAAKGKATELLAGYDDKVKKLADVAGLELTDAEDEDAIKAFTDKLDQIKENVGETPPAGEPKPPRKQPPVGGNNGTTTPPPPKKETDEERLARQEEALAEVTF